MVSSVNWLSRKHTVAVIWVDWSDGPFSLHQTLMIVLLEAGINFLQCILVCYKTRRNIVFPDLTGQVQVPQESLCWSGSAINCTFFEFLISLHAGIWTWSSLCLFVSPWESDPQEVRDWLQTTCPSRRFAGCHAWGAVAPCGTSTVSSHVDRLLFKTELLSHSSRW